MFVPLLINTFADMPPDRPWSASKVLVVTPTDSMASSAGTYAATCGSHRLLEMAPSMRIELAFLVVPFELKASPRAGLTATECMFSGGEMPGTVTNRF